MEIERSLTKLLLAERETYEKMIFVSGPRQVGKTTVLRQLAQKFPGPFLNWDNLDDRRKLSKDPASIFRDNRNVYFDEIHKAPRWKNLLKGYFDAYGDRCRIHVTGSARLDVYRRGADSLLGRYLLFRLHPLTVGELLAPRREMKVLELQELLAPDGDTNQRAHEAWESLEKFGGFPESFLKQSQAFSKRWRAHRHERLVREDIRDLSRIREIALLEQMISLLPDRVAQPFSQNALREDLEVSHDSIRLWTQTLESFYYLFLIPPYSKKIARATRKERKLYLWDYSELSEPGARFENMVAAHLLKWSHAWHDLGLPEIEIRYVKNKQKEEVDFLILRERKPWFLIETKLNDDKPSHQAIKLSHQLAGIPVVQLVSRRDEFKQRKIDSISWTLISASSFVQKLP